MHPRRQPLGLLVMCCLQAAQYIAQTGPWQADHAAYQLGEAVNGHGSSQNILINKNRANRVLRFPDLSTADKERTSQKANIVTEATAQTVAPRKQIMLERSSIKPQRVKQGTMDSGFADLRDSLSSLKQMVLWKIDHNENDKELLGYISELQSIHDLIPASQDYRITRWKGKILVIERGAPNALLGKITRQGDIQVYRPNFLTLDTARKARTTLKDHVVFDPIFGEPLGRGIFLADLEARVLNGKELEAAIEKIQHAWLRRLNQLLHEITTIEAAVRNGKSDALILQQFVLGTVDSMYKRRLIDLRRLRAFLAIEDTLEFASLKKVISSQGIPTLKDKKFSVWLSHYSYSEDFINVVREGMPKRYAHPENWMDDARFSRWQPIETKYPRKKITSSHETNKKSD
ncbi:hypothetical protein KEM48_011327 [Puccinia striiformis f. sp. tritici PST-130]|nr:hypothetical protein Pst134EB_006386 [Puccinia striiformis f. sp. tritici]KAI9628932.1 hypothetical protein KEM48_011327 [Puccinia striiformis f. sp. tritici PST-130]